MVPPYIGHTLSKVWVICVLVSQVFVFFGVFSTELLTLPCKITEVGRLSLFIEFFVGFHIVCDRYTLDNAHFTYFNTIWPLSLSSTFGTAFITGSHIVSYTFYAEELPNWSQPRIQPTSPTWSLSSSLSSCLSATLHPTPLHPTVDSLSSVWPDTCRQLGDLWRLLNVGICCSFLGCPVVDGR